ncbi:hypothetical protein HY857_02165 [Candidatus Saccharibacteria bacterium]|nr:hypothetical protein [Candidatus Saccharibacteria bacterium]
MAKMDPAAKTEPTLAQPIGVKTEIVKDVPVRRQATDNSPVPEAAQNPISNVSHGSTSSEFNEDAELDTILKDVNHEVKAQVDPAKKSKGVAMLSRSAAQLQKTKSSASSQKKSGSRLVVVVAVIVAALLIAAAVYAYRQSQESTNLAKAHQAAVEQAKKQEAAKASPITFGTDYLDSFNSSLSNDSTQDFDANSLSDSTLGL